MYYNSFIPAWTRDQFLSWINHRYPGNKSKHAKIKKKQLIAIWRNSHGNRIL